jgi:uncharacterized membrane protein YtjA (UPF0391 family)
MDSTTFEHARPTASRPSDSSTEQLWPLKSFFTEDYAVTLLKWALVFFIVSLIAALFGFTDIAAASAEVARILFYIFLVIFVVLLVLGLALSRRF